MLARLKNLDPLMVLITAAVIIAIVFPARGGFADVFAIAVKIAIAVLFFLYGARLSTSEALNGLKHWKLHSTIAAITFIIYPIIGVLLWPLTGIISEEIYLGILFMTLVPSTVQSSVAFTYIAGGNYSGAIVAASLSNLAGVFITPILVALLMNTGGEVSIDSSVFINIALQLLLPFILGQIARGWGSGAVARFASRSSTKVVDRGSIAMVVYSAFSAGIVHGVWNRVGIWEVIFLVVFSIIFVIFMLYLSGGIARLLKFNRAERIAIEFCGSKKSLATGLPMAAVIFGGAAVGAMILPLMIFHQVQLMICSWVASRYAKAR